MKITIDRSVLEQALDALVRNYSDKLYDGHSATAASSFEADIASIKALAQPAAQRSGCTAGTDEECTQRGCATKCPQLQPAAQPTERRQCWKCGDADPALQAACDVPACGMREDQPAAQPTEPAGEPVGVVVATRWNADGVTTRYEAAFRPSAGVKAGDMLYIRPAVPLTRERVADLWIAVADIEHATDRQIAYARAIEPAHKIGGAE